MPPSECGQVLLYCKSDTVWPFIVDWNKMASVKPIADCQHSGLQFAAAIKSIGWEVALSIECADYRLKQGSWGWSSRDARLMWMQGSK